MNLAGSTVNGTAAAIARTQMDGVHRYQRPDDDIEFDPTRTRLNGDAERVTVSKFGGGFTRFQSVYQRYSPGFEINDLGFQSRADEQMFRNWFALQFNNPTKAFTRAFFNFNTMQKWTTEGLPTTIGLNTTGTCSSRTGCGATSGGTPTNSRRPTPIVMLAAVPQFASRRTLRFGRAWRPTAGKPGARTHSRAYGAATKDTRTAGG